MKDTDANHKLHTPPRDYRDGIGRTLKKVLWGGFAVQKAFKLIPKGAGFAVSIAMLPVGDLAAGVITEQVLEFTLRQFIHIYETGEASFAEVFGRTIPDKRYVGVNDFWAKVARDKLDSDALIEITGLLSPYGPLMPAHPMSRPGYTVEGWNAIGDLGTKNTEEYDTRDAFIYGDRVIRLSTPRGNKYYAGLYEPYYGLSNVSIPVYLDRTAIKSRKVDIETLWQCSYTPGKIVKVKGRLRKLANFYSQFVSQLPEQYCTLPSFGLEVFEVKAIAEPDGITHMSVSVGWKKRGAESLMAHYFNIQDQQQFIAAEELLEDARDRHPKSLLFNYDDLACFSPTWKHRIPEYNEMLRPWLEKRTSESYAIE